MSAFPKHETIGFADPLTIKLRYKTLTSTFDDLGKEKRRRKWLYPKRDITLSYQYISEPNATTIWQFFMDMHGSYSAFRFFLPLTHVVSYKGEYVDTGDGSTTVFTLPSHQASSVKIYLGSVELATPTDYTFTSQGGTDGADKCEFVVAPTSGTRITMDFAGVLVVKCCFDEDNIQWEEMYDRLNNFGIVFRGMLNDE